MSVAVRGFLASTFLAVLATGCNENGMAVMPGSLSASPSTIDYGMVKENTGYSQTVVLSHKGANSDVRITGLRLEPADAPFQFDDTDLPTVDNPWVLRNNDYRGIDLSFVPSVTGAI